VRVTEQESSLSRLAEFLKRERVDSENFLQGTKQGPTRPGYFSSCSSRIEYCAADREYGKRKVDVLPVCNFRG